MAVPFEGILSEVAARVAHAPVDLDGQVSIVIDVPPEVYELVRLVVHLSGCPLNMAVNSGIPFVRKHMISVMASDTMRPNAVHTTTIDHAHHFSGLLGRLGDDSGIVSVKHVPKRRRQG